MVDREAIAVSRGWIAALAGLAMLAACPDNSGGNDAEAGDSSGTAGAGEFAFATESPDAYVQVDRCGMPAVNTAVIASKDRYNEASPTEDAEGEFVEEIVASVTALHDALDDDLTAAGLVPCAPTDCVEQAAPLVVPDTIKIDPSQVPGFPNGRMLPDPVVDVTLAVVLLDLGMGSQDAATLANIPLNPPTNDKPFLSKFPFLAEPHE